MIWKASINACHWVAASAITAAIGAGYSIYSGERSQDMQQRSLRRQNQAQAEAQNAALSQQRKAEEANRAANQQAPDIASLLAFEQQPGGLSSTMLTGAGGIDRSQLRLGRPSLLGDV